MTTPNEVDIKESEDNVQRSKGIYLLPNLLTTTSLFFGFYAIVSSMKGQFSFVPWAIFIAMLSDSLDGRVARLTNTQSAFGAEYDSLSDVIAFGLAPALFAYNWGLFTLGKIGWLIAFFYTAATALRLARFNSQLNTAKYNKNYFCGLACTAAAGFVTGVLWIASIYQLSSKNFVIFVAVIFVIAGLLMVSNIPYRSFKDGDFKNKFPYLAAILMITIFILVALYPPEVLAAIFFIYAFSGLIATAFKFMHRKKIRKDAL